jgi:hypothetical protein
MASHERKPDSVKYTPYKRAAVEGLQVNGDVQQGPVDPRRDTTRFLTLQPLSSKGFGFDTASPGPVSHVVRPITTALTTHVLISEKSDRPVHPCTPRCTNARSAQPPSLVPTDPMTERHPYMSRQYEQPNQWAHPSKQLLDHQVRTVRRHENDIVEAPQSANVAGEQVDNSQHCFPHFAVGQLSPASYSASPVEQYPVNNEQLSRSQPLYNYGNSKPHIAAHTSGHSKPQIPRYRNMPATTTQVATSRQHITSQQPSTAQQQIQEPTYAGCQSSELIYGQQAISRPTYGQQAVTDSSIGQQQVHYPAIDQGLSYGAVFDQQDTVFVYGKKAVEPLPVVSPPCQAVAFPTAQLGIPAIGHRDYRVQERGVAAQHLRAARLEMSFTERHPSQVSGIPENHRFNFQTPVVAFKPNDIWNLRHMHLDYRLNEFISFDYLYRIMLSSFPFVDGKFTLQDVVNWWKAWTLLKQKTQVLLRDECRFYQYWASRHAKSHMQRAERDSQWFKLLFEQSHTYAVDLAAKKFVPIPIAESAVEELAPFPKSATAEIAPIPVFPSDELSVHPELPPDSCSSLPQPLAEHITLTPEPIMIGFTLDQKLVPEVFTPALDPAFKITKRPAHFNIDESYGKVRPAAAKKARGSNDICPMPELSQTKQMLPLPEYKTNLRDMMDLQKQCASVDIPPIYQADEQELGVGRLSGQEWIAHEQAQITAGKRNLPPNKQSKLVGRTNEESVEVPFYERKYSGDKVSLPDYPRERWQDYTPKPNGLYRCFHIYTDVDCDFGLCTRKGHEVCCHEGMTETRFKAAHSKQKTAWKQKVERMVYKDKTLDPRHVTWKHKQPPAEKDEDTRTLVATRGKKKKAPRRTAPVAAPTQQS